MMMMQVSSQPFITLVHEMMTESEAEHFKDYARDKLVRSGHGNNNVNASGVHSFKVSVHCTVLYTCIIL